MLRGKLYIISIVGVCLLAGCGNHNAEQKDSQIQDEIIYDRYSGYRSYEGKTQEQVLAEGGSDYGISGSFELIREKEDTAENDTSVDSDYDSSWTEEEMISAVNERSQYYQASAYYSEIIDYWENVREVRDISNVIEPLFETDKKYYTKEDFEGEPMLVIHLAKNEIYARHGYLFSNKDLYNYFMGCIWYSPTCDSADFDDRTLNEYEKANLEILAELDTY